jgi:RsiW-degrading membrane proteinase PrsW (M82 family)
MALWVVWIGFITTLVIQTKLHRGWLSIWVLFAAALFGLYDCPAGYISDLVSFHVVVR